MDPIKKVILIDDDPVHNFLSRKLLRSAWPELSVLEFTSAMAALEHIAAQGMEESAIVLLDINMPIMNGWDFIDRFGTLSAELKSMYTIYMVSSSVQAEEIERAHQNPNISAFFSKPMSRGFMLQLPVAAVGVRG